MNGRKDSGLWTKNFTIITVGTAVSLFGNAIAGFATGLLVLDYTGSTFMFALYMILFQFPQIVMPTLSGPYLDKFSRRRAIYTLDFFSAAIYGLFGLIMLKGEINYLLMAVGGALLGAVNNVYQVAYDSFYPMLIPEGYMTKAYSVASTMESMIMIVTPLSVYLYHKIGIAPLFFINMICYFIAACFETRIRAEESYTIKKDERFGLKQYTETFREGMEYLRSEKGLMAVALYFTVLAFTGGTYQIVVLPYFRETHGEWGEYMFLFIGGAMILGRLLASMFHYRHKMPEDRKFVIAFIVYACTALIEGFYLYLPIIMTMVFAMMDGMMGVTSYNIRISATQAYVPDGKKARFNGTFQMMNTVGMLAGQFVAGLLADRLPDKRLVVSVFAVIQFGFLWLLIYRRRADVSKIYNRSA
ncbi:MAG: MFS transporter [Firmicutes bacterium]|nr:MFS transporter [Bacillota bacterium]